MICKLGGPATGVKPGNSGKYASLSPFQQQGLEMSSYGQHATSFSFQQDSALVAQFASHDHPERALAPSDTPEEVAAWNDIAHHESRPKKPTIGRPMYKPEAISTNERSPLLPRLPVPKISEGGGSDHDFDYKRTFLSEVKTLARYTLPVFGCVSHFLVGRNQSLIDPQNP